MERCLISIVHGPLEYVKCIKLSNNKIGHAQ